jgi:hypothetical protein
MKKLILDEDIRLEISRQNAFMLFPTAFIPLVSTFIRDRDAYVIFQDHAFLPMWELNRNDQRNGYQYSLAEMVHYQIIVTLCDTGTVYVDVY